MSKNELLKGLSEEQIEKARSCHSEEDFLNLAKEEGIELSDEQLKSVSGGACKTPEKTGFRCPNCDGTDTVGIFDEFIFNSRGGYVCRCNTCNAVFKTRG